MLLTINRLVTENNILISYGDRSSLMFSLIDLETNTVEKSWGRKGQGPGEFIAVLDFYKNYNNSGINAWDPMQQKLFFLICNN